MKYCQQWRTDTNTYTAWFDDLKLEFSITFLPPFRVPRLPQWLEHNVEKKETNMCVLWIENIHRHGLTFSLSLYIYFPHIREYVAVCGVNRNIDKKKYK